MINPYLLSVIGLMLGLRATKCFWNTVRTLPSLTLNNAYGIALVQDLVVEQQVHTIHRDSVKLCNYNLKTSLDFRKVREREAFSC